MSLRDYINNDIIYSPPIRELVDEHNLMERWLTLIPKIVESLEIDSDEDRQILLDSFDFIRSFIDKLHLTKEENEIFRYFDENLDILKIMHDEHEKIRFYVKILMLAMEEKDKKAIAESLYGYKALLTDHIKNENEIIYPWMDRNLSKSQSKDLFSKFNEINKNNHHELIKFKEFVKKVEKKLKS
ncbi:MAG: hemerythrin domain-containing protein [Candidatus Thorarchaeota archaeon]